MSISTADLETLASKLSSNAVQSVTVKVPPFWPTTPKVWFALLEAQFSSRSITSDETKYNHALQGLDKATAAEISPLLLNPPATGKFEALKAALVKTFDLTKEEKDVRLLAISGLGDRTPSALLRYMRSLTEPEDHESALLRTLFLSHLPDPVRVGLARNPPASLDELAAAADAIASSQPSVISPAGVAAVSKVRKPSSRMTRTSTRCYFHVRFGAEAKKCGQTSSSAPCDMSHLNQAAENSLAGH